MTSPMSGYGYGYNPSMLSGYTSSLSSLYGGNSSLTGYGALGGSYGSSLFSGYQPQMYQTGNSFTSPGMYNFPGQQQGYNNMGGVMSMMMSLMTGMMQMMGQLFQQAGNGQQPGCGTNGTGQQTGTSQGDQTQTVPKNINFKDNKSIQNGMKQLAGNGQAGKLVDSLLKTEIESPQAQKLLAQISKQMKADGKSDEQIKAFGLLSSLPQQNSVVGSLNTILKNLDKNSTEYKQVQDRINAINTNTASIITQYKALE